MSWYAARGGSNVSLRVNKSAPRNSTEERAASQSQTRLLGKSAILAYFRRQNQVLSVESLLPVLGAQHLD